jgi:quinol monooxygenase YgiN
MHAAKRAHFPQVGWFIIVNLLTLRFSRTQKMVHVIATISTAAGSRAKFLEEFHRLVPTVRAEAGCIEYGPTIDVETGINGLLAARNDVVTVVEKWESVEALDAHLKAPHMLRYREAVKNFVASVEIRVTQPA